MAISEPGLSPQAMTERILRKIERLTPPPHPILVALDGRCASGKTTLAARLRAACGCAVVHLDDFFLRPEQRTERRLETPGENVDHERFLEEVLLPLHRGTAAEYRPFDCTARRLGDPVRVEPAALVVVEGSYSCHPSLWPYYDWRVFLTLRPEEQLRRIEQRNGAQAAQVFRTRWIPLEERYFSAFQIAARCDRCFDTTQSGALP